MRIWTQKSASIQKRTNPLKFDNFAEKSQKDTVSYLSSKVGGLQALPSGMPALPAPNAAPPGGWLSTAAGFLDVWDNDVPASLPSGDRERLNAQEGRKEEGEGG